MTPLEQVLAALVVFENNSQYHFVIPFGKSWVNYTKRIRELAKRRGYKWRTAHVEGRRWMINQK